MGRSAWRALAGIGLSTCALRVAVAADSVTPLPNFESRPAPSAAPPAGATDAPPIAAIGSTSASGATLPPSPSSSAAATAAPSIPPVPLATTIATATGGVAPNPPVSLPPKPSASIAAPAVAATPTPGVGEKLPRARSILVEAESAVLEVDYERSLALAQRAIDAGALTRDESRRAYLALSLSAAQLDRQDIALPAFLRLFALDPDVEFTKRLAPARRNAATVALRYWASHSRRLSLDISLNREERQLVLKTTDPLTWVSVVRVWVRKPGAEFVEYSAARQGEVALPLNIEPLETLEVYACGLDDHGNVIVEHRSAEEPERFAPQFEDTVNLQRDIRGGEPGSIALRLAEPGSAASVHGYTSLEFGPVSGDRGATFDLSHATLYIRSQLAREASIDLAVDAEHLAANHRDITLPHAFVDVALQEWMVARLGLFEAPVGAFNEYLWPAFVRTTGVAPLFTTTVVPGLWSELGLQLRGRVSLASRAYLTYAAFVSNGLEQPDDVTGDGIVAEGGDLMAMRYNVLDEHASDKAVGGRIGLQWGNFDVGASGYTGRYTIDAHRQLTIADLDVSYQSRLLTFRAEGAASFQDVTGGWRTKAGAYVLVSSRVAPHLEPYLQYDFLSDRKAVQHRVLFGNAMYPLPLEPNTRTLRLKTEVGVMTGPEQNPALLWLTELVSGF